MDTRFPALRSPAARAAVRSLVLIALSACSAAEAAERVDENDINGVVTGPNGPEAGVWVIAETTDLPTVLQ